MTDETPSFVDMEKIEQEIENEKVALNAGYLTYDRFLEKKLGAAQGLIQFGDAFCRALGETLLIADRDNAIKILRYFHTECNQNALLWEIFQAKQKASNS